MQWGHSLCVCHICIKKVSFGPYNLLNKTWTNNVKGPDIHVSMTSYLTTNKCGVWFIIMFFFSNKIFKAHIGRQKPQSYHILAQFSLLGCDCNGHFWFGGGRLYSVSNCKKTPFHAFPVFPLNTNARFHAFYQGSSFFSFADLSVSKAHHIT